nr:retrovirus-related Pol polyprotein from transposon TNT 1-94 [Tanacetum cinerariifolium]
MSIMPYESKYKTAQEFWAVILKTFGGNEATKNTKKNLLKQQYGNFKAEGSKTLEQTFNRLQVIVGQVQFMDVEIEQDDLNQKFLTILAPNWLMHTIKKSKPNSQNMAFISSAKHNSRNKDGNTACVSTASTNVPTASASVVTISQDAAYAYIASQSSGSQIKFEDINQIDEDEMEEMDIKWNMALLSMRADKFWKKTGKKISIQGSDVTGFDKSKFECFNCHKMGHFATECRAPRSQERGRRDNYRQGSKAEERASKALMAIDEWDEFALMANTSAESKKLDTLKEEKEGVDGKLAGLLTASKDLNNLIESQRSDKNKDRLGYNDVPPPSAQLYLSHKKDLSWTGLPKYADDTVTDYIRPSPTVDSTSGDDQNRNPFVSETVASPIIPKPFIKFVKPKDSQSKSKTGKTESPKKPPVKKRVKKSFIPKPVAHRPYRPPVRPVRTNMNGARPSRTSFNKQAHSYANRPFHRTSAGRSHYKAPWVPTVNRTFPPVNRKFPTASRKFLAGSTKCSTADMGMKGKAEKGDEGYFIGYSMSSKAFKVFNKRTRRVEENLHVEFLENKAIEKGIKDATSQEKKKDASSLRYIALPNWAHDALLEFFLSKPQDHCSTKVPEGSRNPNPTASTLNPPSDPMETRTVESPIPTNVWTLVDCPKGIRPIGTKWVLKNKKDEKGIVIRNKARLVAQANTQEEGIDYDEVFAPVARIVAIRLFLAYASFMGFTVYYMDVKSTFLYGTIDEEVYVMQPLGFQDPEFPAKVYKVEKAMYGLHQAPRAWYGILSKYLLKNGFQRGTIDQTLFIRRQTGDFILVQVYVDDIIFGSSNPQLYKYVGDILKKFGYSNVKSSNTLMDKENPWGKDGTGKDVDLHLYRSMIGSLMYHTASRPDIMFATIMATSTTEAEYVAAAGCCGQVLWIQNQLLDYGEVLVLSCKY